jgi:glutathione S-transferase
MSLPVLVIGTKNLSSWSLRAWLALKHLGIELEEIELPLDTPEFHRRIAQYSAAKRVPVLIDQDVAIWDSLAICEYANELCSGKGWPRDARERAQARSISAEMHSGFQALRTCWPMSAASVGRNASLTMQATADLARIDTIWHDCCARHAAHGPWLFGDYSIADAMYAPMVLRFRTYGARLSAGAQRYMTAALADCHLQTWITESRAD